MPPGLGGVSESRRWQKIKRGAPFVNRRVGDGVKLRIARPVYRLAGVASGQNGQPALPGPFEDHHGIDIVAGDRRAIAVDHVGLELRRDRFGLLCDAAADGPNVKPILQHSQSRAVASLPRGADFDQTDA
jgi:hypothetical protein